MFLTKTKYTLRDSLRQITRHKLFSFLTILTIAITLALLSAASLVAANSYNATQSIEDQLRCLSEAAVGSGEEYRASGKAGKDRSR